MTENENWVMARANCTLDRMFEELTNVMETDIERFNSLLHKTWSNRNFGSSFVRDTGFEIYQVVQNLENWIRMDGDSVLVKQTSTCIRASRSGQEVLTITPRWNEDSLTCDLMVMGKPLSVGQISQRLLGNFFFG